MKQPSLFTPDPKLDLVFERDIETSPERVWACWTQPEHLGKWFTPAPWSVVDCKIDLRPGGVFSTVMQGPDGTQMPNVGCYLEVVPNRRLVWTTALLAGYRPSGNPFFTGVISLEPHGTGTRYMALARHPDEATRQQHETMGFSEGWGKALDQLIEHAKTL